MTIDDNYDLGILWYIHHPITIQVSHRRNRLTWRLRPGSWRRRRRWPWKKHGEIKGIFMNSNLKQVPSGKPLHVGDIIYKWWFSIAMLNYQRVSWLCSLEFGTCPVLTCPVFLPWNQYYPYMNLGWSRVFCWERISTQKSVSCRLCEFDHSSLTQTGCFPRLFANWKPIIKPNLMSI